MSREEAAKAAARTIGLLLGGCLGMAFTLVGLLALWGALLVRFPAPTCIGSIAALFVALAAQVWWDQYLVELNLRKRSDDAHPRA